LSLPVREAVEVLCIEGRPGSARYLAYALEPERSPRPRIRPTIGLENALLERNLADFDAVFLCNVARLTEDEAGVLAAYVLGGGGLVITVGDLVQAENYNLRLGDATPRVLPARLGAMSEESFYGFDPLQYRHPIIAPFAGHERSGLLTTPIWRSLCAEPYEPDAARVALAYPNGAPAIIEESFGQGRCLLLTTAVSGESIDRSTTPPTPWSALASWPSFPPLVQEMLRYAARRHDQRNVRVGEPLHGRPTDLPGNVVLTVETPLGENERVPLQVDGASSHWEFDHTVWSGVYRAQLGPPVLQEQQFAVNVDTRESDLKPLDREAMPPEFDADLEIDATTDPLPGSRPRQLFRYLLGLVLILLLTESLVAWRLGTASA
jgi:hypothetical protein